MSTIPGQVPQPTASPLATPVARKRSREASEAADGPSSPRPIKRERINEEEADILTGTLRIPAETEADVGHNLLTPFIKREVDGSDYLSGFADWREDDQDTWRGNTEDEEPWEVRLYLELRGWHPEHHVASAAGTPRGAWVMDDEVDSGYNSDSSNRTESEEQGI